MTKLALLASPAFLAFSLFAAGCASDPVQKADDAHDKQLEDNRKVEQTQAGHREDATATNATQERKAETANGAPPADAKLIEARKIAMAKAQERTDKADARIRELKAKVQAAGGKAPTQARDSLTTVDTQRAVVQSELDIFPSVPNDGFESAKGKLGSDLDTLEGLVDKSTKEVSKMK